MKAVFDTSALSPFLSMEREDLVFRVVEFPIIPKAVKTELLARPNPEIIDRTMKLIEKCKVLEADALEAKVLFETLNRGEAEAIALAKEHRLPIFLDDLLGRKAAKRLGIKVGGSLTLLGLLKARGEIPAVSPLIDDMIRNGEYLSPVLVKKFLASQGEIQASDSRD